MQTCHDNDPSQVCKEVMLYFPGFNDMFGGRASMTGPLLIALAFLLLLVSMRQFLIARKRNVETQDGIQVAEAFRNYSNQ